MSTPFEIKRQWSATEPDRVADGSVSAEIAIWTNGICLTAVEDRVSSATRNVARLSALRMARWFAGNWWRLRWEPENRARGLDWQMSHNLAAAGGSYLWPNLTFSSDGDTVLIKSRAGSPASEEPIRYTQDYDGVIPLSSFEQVVDDFVTVAIDRIPGVVAKDTDLAELWAEVADERDQPELYDLRKLEAGLGYDPGEAPDPLIEALQSERNAYGAAAIHEMAVASGDQALAHLHRLGAETRSQGISAQVSNCDTILRLYREQENPWDQPWQRGALAAGIARSVWGIPIGPLRTGTLSELFHLDLTAHSGQTLPLSAGLRDSNGGLSLVFNQGRLTGRRFTLSRLVADHIISPQEERLLPSTRVGTSRQKFQRAFAQEFLCPINDLQDFLGAAPADDDIDDAAAHFEVSPLTVKTTLGRVDIWCYHSRHG